MVIHLYLQFGAISITLYIKIYVSQSQLNLTQQKDYQHARIL